MTSQAVPTQWLARPGYVGGSTRVAFLGPSPWVENCSPAVATQVLTPQRITAGPEVDPELSLAALARFRPQVTVLLDPLSIPDTVIAELPGLTLGVLVGEAPGTGEVEVLRHLDRVLSFRPELTTRDIGSTRVWRAIPPPVSDELFADARPPRGKLRAMTIGRSTDHREAMLMPAKHHHDLLQVLHGLSGSALAELLTEYDVGVYVAPSWGAGFGQQVGMHLAAGQLLLTEALRPAHGLERNIDYLQFESPDELVDMLDRLDRFPEMHDRIRIRGRLKAEQYRASRLFARLVRDLIADVAAFGSGRV